jgi:predicted permease
VDVVSLAAFPPLRESFLDFDVKIDGRPLAPNEPTPHAPFRAVEPNYFGAVGISILRGRGFESTDRLGSARVAILSQSFARQLYGDADPLGRRIAPTGEVLKVSPFTGDWRTIVGVVADARNAGVENSPGPTVYEPFAQEFMPGAALVVRSSLDPAELGATIVRTIHDMAPQQLIEHVETLDQIRDESVAPRRLNALFVAVFGGLAVAIAMVGIAGVLAFSVRSRTPEIGIRMSLGADAARVRGMVLTEGGTLLVVGVALGLIGALFATRVLRSLLFGITAHDPFTLGAAAIGLAGVGLLACWIPAARAAQVDPAMTLRSE